MSGRRDPEKHVNFVPMSTLPTEPELLKNLGIIPERPRNRPVPAFRPREDPSSEDEDERVYDTIEVDSDHGEIASDDESDDMPDFIFDGKDASQLTDFLRFAEAYFELHDKFTGNEKRKAAFIIVNMRRPATLWLDQAAAATPEVETNYTQLKAALLERYAPSADEARLRAIDTVRAIKQKGSLEAYDTYFESMWARSGLTDASEKARLFLNGLYPSIRRYVMELESYTTTKDKDWMLAKAERQQSAREASHTTRMSAIPETPRRAQGASNACFACGKTGHWVADCPTRSGGKSASRPREGRTRSRSKSRRRQYTPLSGYSS